MNKLYNALVRVAEKLLPLPAAFSPKMKQFVEGRKGTFSILRERIKPEDKVIWFHAASLGEFEQGVPIIEIVKKIFPNHKIVVSFFSPSGYENKKNTPLADVVVYLPLDTPANAKTFVELMHPDLALFIKYEFWPNYLQVLKDRKIHTLLISGAFREDQVFFKSYGSWMKRSLETFEHFFVQNEHSKELLGSIGFSNVTVSGDTRFDRVAHQPHMDNRLDFIEVFLGGKTRIVAGSTWPEDEKMLLDFINNSLEEVKFIIAPHQIDKDEIERFRKKINRPVILFSEKEKGKLSEFKVMIIDTIGLLTRIYSYSDIAYVGGAAGNTGLHNILEPAAFGVPIVIGKNFQKFPEAKQLQNMGGLFSVDNSKELQDIFNKLLKDEDFRKRSGLIAGQFIGENTGAGNIVEAYLRAQNVKNP